MASANILASIIWSQVSIKSKRPWLKKYGAFSAPYCLGYALYLLCCGLTIHKERKTYNDMEVTHRVISDEEVPEDLFHEI